MPRKIDITPSEMMEMRNQGMSNHDIAAFADSPKVHGADPLPERREAYCPKPTWETYSLANNAISVKVGNVSGSISISKDDGSIALKLDEARELVQFLAWLSRRAEEREEI